jgi:hypothetical protein
MWLFGMLAYLIPAVLITIQLMAPLETSHQRHARVTIRGISEDRCNSSKLVTGG